jgi:hypothetical protein
VLQAPSSKSSGGLIEDDSSLHVWGSLKDIHIQGLYIQERLFTSQGHLGYDEKMIEN